MMHGRTGVRIVAQDIEPGWPGLVRETAPGRTHLVKVHQYGIERVHYWLVDEVMAMIEIRLYALLAELLDWPRVRVTFDV